MSKLPKEYQFLDLSDYGRFVARWIANSLKKTSVTPIHVTSWFIVSGLLAILCMLYQYYITAAFFLILKSILDAADGELSRIKNTPSYIGRYYDSIADIILNFLFFLTFWHITDGSIMLVLLAFIGVQLQGTLYNYYYVILRNNVNGDSTSRIFEDSAPIAMKGEKQQTVDLFYKIYDFLYIVFDKTIYFMDKEAMNSQPFPKWFMTLLSTFGLGFQLLIMAIMLVLHLEIYIVPFFIGYSIFILFFIAIRRFLLS
jgi:CDP-diacylglycerol--serine O-phosphatidyltransferase